MNILIYGYPYSGKGTQGTKIAQEFDLMHVSTGEILRAEENKGTELGLISKSFTEQGLFAPNQLVVDIMENLIKENKDKVKGFLFDGFPRMLIQAESFDIVCERLNIKIDLVLGLTVPEEELIKRGIERAKTSTRLDDNSPEKILKRLSVHKELSEPLEHLYKQRSIYRTIDGTGSIEEVYKRLFYSIHSFLSNERNSYLASLEEKESESFYKKNMNE